MNVITVKTLTYTSAISTALEVWYSRGEKAYEFKGYDISLRIANVTYSASQVLSAYMIIKSSAIWVLSFKSMPNGLPGGITHVPAKHGALPPEVVNHAGRDQSVARNVEYEGRCDIGLPNHRLSTSIFTEVSYHGPWLSARS